MTGAALIRGDALDLALADESVDLIITSPPYFALRSYQDGGEHYDGQIGSEATPAAFLAALWAVTDECYRVLKPTGSLWVNLGDKYAGSGAPGTTSGLDRKTSTVKTGTSRYVNTVLDVPAKSLMGLPWRYALGLTCPMTYRTDLYDGRFPQWTLRAEVIWNKPNGLPESVNDRVRRSHEQWFHLTKAGRYYAAVDEVREKYAPGTAERYAVGYTQTAASKAGQTNNGVLRADGGGPNATNPLGKLPGSVWTIASEPLVVPPELGVDHFAAFPTEWPRRIVLGWSPSGICVKCGDGRAPVVEKSYTPMQATNNHDKAARNTDNNFDRSAAPFGRAHAEATITGHSCRCDVPIAPTRPAVVLDPFAGTGTVPLVARTLGRYGIGVDLSHDYLRLARWRVFRSGHGAKAENRTNRERQGALW